MEYKDNFQLIYNSDLSKQQFLDQYVSNINLKFHRKIRNIILQLVYLILNVNKYT